MQNYILIYGMIWVAQNWFVIIVGITIFINIYIIVMNAKKVKMQINAQHAMLIIIACNNLMNIMDSAFARKDIMIQINIIFVVRIFGLYL